jgi:lysophospholipase L1-like esterase
MLKLLRILAGLLIISVTAVIATARANDSPPGWLGTSLLGLQKEAQLSAVPPSLNNNIDCQQETTSNCAIATGYGKAASDGKVLLNNTLKYYPVFTNIDNQQHFQAIPNSNSVISYDPSATYGAYLYFNHEFSSSISVQSYYDGQNLTYKYVIDRPPDGKLADQDGHLLPADYDSMGFSANGRWMVVSDPNNFMLRVNLDDFQVTPFDFGFNYRFGLAPVVQTAISNDGRYAAVASKNFGPFKIYDLNTCDPVATTITSPAGCQSRDLQSFMTGQVAGFVNATHIRFISDDTLSLYVTSVVDGVQTTAKYVISAGTGGLHQVEYLALGDSYISGEGAYDYQAGTDTDDNSCHLSLISYPLLLGLALDFNSYHSVACSGAMTDDIVNTSDTYMGRAAPKIPRSNRPDAQVQAILSDFLPGYIDQLDFVSQYQPKVITLSAGGNDMGFSAILKKCIETGTCYDNYEDRLELVNEINNSVFPKLVDTYQQIKNLGAPDARIYVIGYPQIVNPGGDCGDNVRLNAQEVEFASQLISYLDSTVQAAAAKAGVVYVDTQQALNGHRLCEAANKYELAVNGVTAGNDNPKFLHGPLGNESFHPNFVGHELLEQAILIDTQNLTQSMPESADLSSSPPDKAHLPILGVPGSGRSVNVSEYDPGISDDIIYKDSLSGISVNGIKHSLPANNNLQVVLHSDPVALGSFNTDLTGNFSGQILVPATIAPGFHTMDLYGTDLTGQQVDIYKTVYIAGSPNDLDGDGIPDNQDPCVGVPASDNDADQDGIDDACDGFIGAPPQPSAASPAALAASQTGASEFALAQSSNRPDKSEPKVLAANKIAAAAAAAPANDKNLRLSSSYVIGFALATVLTIALAYATKD